jgi:hypothetical protein
MKFYFPLLTQISIKLADCSYNINFTGYTILIYGVEILEKCYTIDFKFNMSHNVRELIQCGKYKSLIKIDSRFTHAGSKNLVHSLIAPNNMSYFININLQSKTNSNNRVTIHRKNF